MLKREKNFYLRVNFWLPTGKEFAMEKHNMTTVYEKPHCHNFNFLTLGILGPGYETAIYEYDYSKVKGIPGEAINARFLEKTSLPKGKMMIYRSGIDIHDQIPPKEISISFNLMGYPGKGKNKLNQYFFDLESNKLRGTVNNSMSGFLIRLASEFGDENTKEILDSISKDHFCSRTRVAAFQGLAKMMPYDKKGIWNRAINDTNPIVQFYAKQNIEI